VNSAADILTIAVNFAESVEFFANA
jgi:hypothetical protein